jgi:hypothetical protein
MQNSNVANGKGCGGCVHVSESTESPLCRDCVTIEKVNGINKAVFQNKEFRITPEWKNDL